MRIIIECLQGAKELMVARLKAQTAYYQGRSVREEFPLGMREKYERRAAAAAVKAAQGGAGGSSASVGSRDVDQQRTPQAFYTEYDDVQPVRQRAAGGRTVATTGWALDESGREKEWAEERFDQLEQLVDQSQPEDRGWSDFLARDPVQAQVRAEALSRQRTPQRQQRPQYQPPVAAADRAGTALPLPQSQSASSEYLPPASRDSHSLHTEFDSAGHELDGRQQHRQPRDHNDIDDDEEDYDGESDHRLDAEREDEIFT